jgi:diguanylate cyclase (GGDEF)-like protein/PAS domain S-box-containing protein
MRKSAKTRVPSVISDNHQLAGAQLAAKVSGAEQLLYRFLVDSLTEYAVFAVSPDGNVISWNVGAAKTFGYSEADVLGKSFEIIFTAEDKTAGAPQDELSSALSGEQTQHDRWHVRQDGTRFWGTNTVQPLYDADGVLLGFTKLVRDTTKSHVALEELSDSEQQLRLLVESVREYAIFSIELDGRIKSWNSGAQKVFGYEQADILGRNFALLYSVEDISNGVPQAELRRARVHGHANVERWLVRKDGTRFLASGKISQLKRDPAGQLRGFVNIAHDITGHHAAAEDLRRRAQYDELTELPNRRTFYEHVSRAIGAMKRRPSNAFAVLFIDLDHFKAVNDEFGHIIADELLAVTARRLEHCIRSEDIVARLGGDEFAILINGIAEVSDAADAAQRIGLQMRKALTIDGRDVRATVSVGIAIGSIAYDRPEDILRDADSAMYVAKSEGRARAVLFDASMASSIDLNVDLAGDMRYALERNELRVVYQPIVRLSDATLVGFESLVRWEHPRRGLLLPAQFIPKAEESGLILSIDRWMLAEGCRQLAAWQAAGFGDQLQMSVNVSTKEFTRDDFVADLGEILESSGLSPSRLRLEITESAIMEQSTRVNLMLAEIRKLGIELDVDDFGTGYSSLAALQHIAVDALKIDSSFVAGMSSPIGKGLVETVIYLAHKLDLVVVAEGIETVEQLGRLARLGCDFGQGFFFAPPLDTQAAAAYMRRTDLARLP